jgi:hypothetical protein
MPHVPGFTVRKLLVGFLEAETLEVVLVGLRATLQIMLRSAQRLQATTQTLVSDWGCSGGRITFDFWSSGYALWVLHLFLAWLSRLLIEHAR